MTVVVSVGTPTSMYLQTYYSRWSEQKCGHRFFTISELKTVRRRSVVKIQGSKQNPSRSAFTKSQNEIILSTRIN